MRQKWRHGGIVLIVLSHVCCDGIPVRMVVRCFTGFSGKCVRRHIDGNSCYWCCCWCCCCLIATVFSIAVAAIAAIAAVADTVAAAAAVVVAVVSAAVQLLLL